MQKIKQFIESDKGKDILVVAIVILVGLASFGLGRLSKEGSSGLKLEYTGQSANAISASAYSAKNEFTRVTDNNWNNNSGKFFASSRGSKYYPESCSAGQNIKKENRVYFDTREEAQNAGYELSSSCR